MATLGFSERFISLKKALAFASAFFWARSIKMQLALFYVIPFFTDFEISYRFVRNEKESFLKLIFYT